MHLFFSPLFYSDDRKLLSPVLFNCCVCYDIIRVFVSILYTGYIPTIENSHFFEEFVKNSISRLNGQYFFYVLLQKLRVQFLVRRLDYPCNQIFMVFQAYSGTVPSNRSPQPPFASFINNLFFFDTVDKSSITIRSNICAPKTC